MTGASDDRVERWGPVRAWVYSLVSGNPRSNRMLVELADPGPGDTVLDVGCGAGAAVRLAAAAGARAIGVDPSPAMIGNARRRGGPSEHARFVEAHAARLPFEDSSFSMAWAIATFHHWPDRAAGLAEIRRVLAPGGCLFLAERLVRNPRAHGLTDAGARETADAMAECGYDGVQIHPRRLVLSSMLIISGRV